jgi:tRNA-splicing ligase RtcB
MPDCHVGYGMPIGGVIAADNALIPYAVGVDIGCGMAAVETDIPAERFSSMEARRALAERIKERIPAGEGHHHKGPCEWDGFERYLDSGGAAKLWPNGLDRMNLGTLGGGNHFIELQADEDGFIWLMLHSGSRNLGQRVASRYHKEALDFVARENIEIPDKDLAFLRADSKQGEAYFRDMTFALDYAMENRRRMMAAAKEELAAAAGPVTFKREVNIHHNYAVFEEHFGRGVWIHRKGATSAKKDEPGIIPGSMGTPSYIVVGRGSPESFMSCSHGAGRAMGRNEANRTLSAEDCDKAMTGIVFDRWGKCRSRHGKKDKGLLDLSEAPAAYKNIDDVMSAQTDLTTPVVKLRPLAVVKG